MYSCAERSPPDATSLPPAPASHIPVRRDASRSSEAAPHHHLRPLPRHLCQALRSDHRRQLMRTNLAQLRSVSRVAAAGPCGCHLPLGRLAIRAASPAVVGAGLRSAAEAGQSARHARGGPDRGAGYRRRLAIEACQPVPQLNGSASADVSCAVTVPRLPWHRTAGSAGQAAQDLARAGAPNDLGDMASRLQSCLLPRSCLPLVNDLAVCRLLPLLSSSSSPKLRLHTCASR